MTLHRELAGGRWATLTLAEQLGNAGSDVGRAIRARTSGDRERFAPALDRALELLDLTLEDERVQAVAPEDLAAADASSLSIVLLIRRAELS